MMTVLSFSVEGGSLTVKKEDTMYIVNVCEKKVYGRTVQEALMLVRARGYADLDDNKIDYISDACEVSLAR